MNGDDSALHYVRQFQYSSGANTLSGQETSQPGLVVGQLNATDESFYASNDTLITLGVCAGSYVSPVTAVTRSVMRLQGQLTFIDNASRWTVSNAVTSINMAALSGYFKAGSTFYLYGY